MTIKEASVNFNLDEKEIRARKKDNMIIGVRKDGNNVVIPNDNLYNRGFIGKYTFSEDIDILSELNPSISTPYGLRTSGRDILK